ncbi:MAG TPA: hypothetical protein V6D03_05555 [Candidatus Caenarcaniphilales bacterium]
MAGFPEPPYFLLVAGVVAALASGIAFQVTLKQLVEEWSRTRSTRTLSNLRGTQLLVPFLGISGGIWIFLASGLAIFGFANWLGYAVSLVLTLFTSVLVWTQLGKLLLALEKGGSQALDLDFLDAKK